MDPKLDDLGNRPFPLKYTVGLLILAVLLVIAAFGGIRGCELQKQAPVAKAAALSMHDLAHACAERTDREMAPVEMRLFGKTFPVHRDAPDPGPLTLLAVLPFGVPIMKYFRFDHLPEKLQVVSRPVGELAEHIVAELPDCAERTAGLRKLLEAKDCFVRQATTGEMVKRNDFLSWNLDGRERKIWNY